MGQVRDIITTVLIALIVFVVLQLTVGSFKVYGQSMMPTIENGDYILVDKVSYILGDPHRGDIIIFHHPNRPKIDLIKRIIGLPGDKIEVKGGKVFVNTIEIKEDYIMEPPKYEYTRNKVPANSYLVLGDNRNNSSDSHTGWTVPRQNIVGKAWLNYWPISNWGTIENASPALANK